MYQIDDAFPTFEFYLPVPNDTRIYRVRYTALRLFEVARLLNNCIDLSHISDNQLSHHYDVQSLIQQQIRQNLVESQIYQQIGTQQLSFYSDSSIYNTTLIPSNLNDNIHP